MASRLRGCCSGVFRQVFRLTKLTILLLAAYLLFVLVRNENTFGDKFRHRPQWIPVVSRVLPYLELEKDWFLHGNEDKETLEAFDVLLESINTEAALTKIGKVCAIGLVKEMLDQRNCVLASVEEKRKKNKGVRKTPAPPPPVIVTGLPRTGTTFLQSLLAVDEARFRAPRFHEYMDACPMPARRTGGGTMDWLRIQIQELRLFFVRSLVPEMKAIHYIDATTPEEDVVPLGHTMISALYPTAFYLPTYMEWLQKDFARKAKYSVSYLKLYLDEHLRLDDTPQWLLKTPWHVAQIKELEDVFPDAKVIWTHREPIKQVSSLISVAMHMIGMATDRPRYIESQRLIANKTVDLWLWALERGVEARRKLPPTLFFDVSCEELTDAPVPVVERIYKHFKWELSEEVKTKFQRYADANKRGSKYGVHSPDFSALELDMSMIQRRYVAIMSRIKLNYGVSI